METKQMNTPQGAVFSVVLASSSPQRQQILRELGIHFRLVDPQVSEVTLSDAAATVVANARMKALGALASCSPEEAVLGADTVLCVNGNVRGKPESREEAVRFLAELSGDVAVAWTGVAAFSADTGRGVVLVEHAEIVFADFTEAAVAWYVGTGEPLTRAGALGISLLGEVFVQNIRGAHSCVTGLPKRATLLACSDEALGRHRLELPKAVRDMLQWPWIDNEQRFFWDGCPLGSK